MVRSSKVKPRKKPKQKRSQATVDAILQATTHILEEEGFAAMSTNKVAKRAGVSIGSLYQYFPNKESLVKAIFEQHHAEMIGLLQRSVQELATAPIEEAVRRYVRLMLEAHSVNPRLHKILSEQVLHLGWDFVGEMQQAACVLVKSYLVLHQDEILPKDLDMAAFVLVTSVETITHAAILELEAEFALEPLEREICALILRYLLGRCGEEEQ